MDVPLRMGTGPQHARDDDAPEAELPGVRRATDAQGRQVAWSDSGSGTPALVEVSGWFSHLELDWRDPALGGFQRDLAAQRRLLRYDRPGVGLSSAADAGELDAGVDALEAVVRAAGEDRVALFAHSFGAAAAVGLSVRRPELVSHLVLFGASARPLANDRPGGLSGRVAAALEKLAAADWNLASRTLADLLMPGADAAQRSSAAERMRASATPQAAAELLNTLRSVDISGMLAQVAVPTLLLHRRDDLTVPLQAAREIAERIPGARLEILDGGEHLPYLGATDPVLAAIGGFLDAAR